MRITGVTTHIIEYDLREAWGDRPGPEELHNTSYSIPLVTLHTDEGIDGHTTHYGGLGEGRAIGHAGFIVKVILYSSTGVCAGRDRA